MEDFDKTAEGDNQRKEQGGIQQRWTVCVSLRSVVLSVGVPGVSSPLRVVLGRIIDLRWRLVTPVNGQVRGMNWAELRTGWPFCLQGACSLAEGKWFARKEVEILEQFFSMRSL